jgi:hypothetical protein
MRKGRRRLSLRARLALLAGGLLAAALLALLALAAQDRRLARAAFGGDRMAPAFARRGDVYETVNLDMVDQSFDAVKKPGEFRVFVLGSSQAMGVPYADPRHNALSNRRFGLPNEGGISTWLRRYLETLLEGRRVVVVNAAKAARDLKHSVATMREIVAIGSPDLVVVLEGNNERSLPQIDRQTCLLSPEADVQRAVDALTRGFRAELRELVRLAERARVPTYVLTVPNNLRDWPPTGAPDGPDGSLREGEPLESAAARARAILARRPDEPVGWMLKAAVLERGGDVAGARAAFIKAKDLDRGFLRTRSAWNDAIRAVKSPYARVLDLERLMFERARGGIPGSDLFHDYCHLTLAGNRAAAFEIARRLREDWGVARPLALEDADLRDYSARRLRLLYAIKALRWIGYRWRAGPEAPFAANAETVARAYLAEMGSIDEQLRLYR